MSVRKRPGLRPCAARVLRVAMVLVAVAWAGRALAQGTSGTFADPLSVGELKALIERRGPVPQGAWPSLQSAHERYVAQCAELREGDIERFQKSTRAREAAGRVPSPSEMQSFLKDHAALARRLEALDQELFAAVAQALPDAAVTVEAARLQRQRDAMREGFGRMLQAGSSMADVERVAFDLELGDAMRERVGKALEGYGARQVAAMREMGERQQQLWVEAMKDIAESMKAAEAAAAAEPGQGGDVVPATPTTPAIVEGGAAEVPAAGDAQPAPDPMAERGKATWTRLGPPIIRQRKALIESNRTAAKAVREALAAEPALERRFWNAWRAAAHPGVRGGEDVTVPALARRALRIKGLDDAARDAIRQALAEWWAADDAIAAEWGAAIDEFECTQGPFSFDAAGFQEFSGRLQQFAQRQEERGALALATISVVIGEDRIPLMKGSDRSRDDELLEPEIPDAELAGMRGSGGERQPEPHVYVARLQDRMRRAWSQPMGPEDVARIAAALRADDASRAVIESLAADHAADWRERIDPLFLAARPDSPADLQDPAKSLERWPGVIASAAAVRDEIDGKFFADLESLTSEPAHARGLAMMRTLRAADSAACDSMASMGASLGHTVEPVRVDPLRGAVAHGLPAQEIEAALAAAEPLLPRLKEETDQLQAAVRRAAEIQRQMAAAGPIDTPERQAVVEQLGQESVRSYQAQALARAALGKAEDAMAGAVLAAIPESRRAAVRTERLRARHPAYFSVDPVQSAFDRAAALPGLDAAMRDSIAAAAAAYAKGRETADAGLLAALTARPMHPTFGDAEAPGAMERWQKEYAAWMLAEEKVAKAAFARRGVREQALVGLSAILGKDRAAAARLPDAARLARDEERRKSGMEGLEGEADEDG